MNGNSGSTIERRRVKPPPPLRVSSLVKQSENNFDERKVTQISVNLSQTPLTTPSIQTDATQHHEESEMRIVANEIELTIQTLNDELNKLDTKQECRVKDSNETKSIENNEFMANYSTEPNKSDTKPVINISHSNALSVLVKPVKNLDAQTIRNKFESKYSTTSRVPKISSVNGKTQVMIDSEESKLTNGKTRILVHKNDSTDSRLNTPSNENNNKKFSAEEAVHQLCRPRVKLTNFSIGSYNEKDVSNFYPVVQSLIAKTESKIKYESQNVPQVKTSTRTAGKSAQFFTLPKGWRSERSGRNGGIPQVKRVDPLIADNVNVGDALVNEIKSFNGNYSLKKVSKNSSTHLEK